MKKLLVLLVVLAITSFSVMAFAADVTVGGSIEVRSRAFSNLNVQTKDTQGDTGEQRDTQNRIRIDVNAKTDNVKAKLELQQDFSDWGNFVEKYSNGSTVGDSTGLGFREAWINFNLPGIPVNVNVGHQLLQLGMGTFFRSQHFGSDAWVLANVTGNNTVAFVDVKALERSIGSADDIDAYVLLDVIKLSDKMTLGADLTYVKDRNANLSDPTIGTALTRHITGGTQPFEKIDLYNLGINLTAAAGPLNLKAQIDLQGGKAKAAAGGSDQKFKGNDIVIKGDMAAGAAALNFTVARGTGNKAGDNDIKQLVTILDIDPHYTFLYEYKVKTAAANLVSQKASDDQLHTGFANTTALNIGGGMDVSKSLNLNAQLWYLKATEKVALNNNAEESDKLGYELDVKATWKLYDNLTWTWDLGYFKPGDAYKLASGQSADAVTGIQGILAFKF